LKFDLPGALLFLVIVPGVALNRGLVNQFLSQPIFYFLGVISYSAYLDHNLFRPIAFELMHFFQPAGLDGKTALIFAFFASLSIIPVAWVTYRYIEYPSRQILRRTLAKRVSSENSV
jgi:peptidoglycan/LPS O-acetylase OafA/YrhL